MKAMAAAPDDEEEEEDEFASEELTQFSRVFTQVDQDDGESCAMEELVDALVGGMLTANNELDIIDHVNEYASRAHPGAMTAWGLINLRGTHYGTLVPRNPSWRHILIGAAMLGANDSSYVAMLNLGLEFVAEGACANLPT